MNQFILRQIPADLDKALRTIAKQKSSSLNKVVIALLKKSLGLDDTTKKKRDLSKLSGTWTQKQAEEFARNTEVFEKIDPELWNL